MIRHAWRWYDDAADSQYFVDLLMELDDGSLCVITYGGLFVLDGQSYLDSRVKWDLSEMFADTSDCDVWRRIF